MPCQAIVVEDLAVGRCGEEPPLARTLADASSAGSPAGEVQEGVHRWGYDCGGPGFPSRRTCSGCGGDQCRTGPVWACV